MQKVQVKQEKNLPNMVNTLTNFTFFSLPYFKVLFQFSLTVLCTIDLKKYLDFEDGSPR